MNSDNKKISKNLAELLKSRREDKQKERLTRFSEGINDLHSTFPDADIEAELKNETFLRLIRSGIEPTMAFKAVHHDEIVYSMMKRAVLDELERVQAAQDLQRPEENTLSDMGGFDTKTDVSLLSKKDRQALAKRALMGEKIIL